MLRHRPDPSQKSLARDGAVDSIGFCGWTLGQLRLVTRFGRPGADRENLVYLFLGECRKPEPVDIDFSPIGLAHQAHARVQNLPTLTAAEVNFLPGDPALESPNSNHLPADV